MPLPNMVFAICNALALVLIDNSHAVVIAKSPIPSKRYPECLRLVPRGGVGAEGETVPPFVGGLSKSARNAVESEVLALCRVPRQALWQRGQWQWSRAMAGEAGKQQVYTLVVEVGRKAGDGLPDKSTGAALMCYASGVDEAEAVRETVAILKAADLAPLDVSGYGTLEERLKAGDEIDDEERALMERALAENSVVVAQMNPFFD
jgi:hypothetical protein